MNTKPVHNSYIQEKIEQRRNVPMGRDVPDAYSLHSRTPQGQAGCGPALAVLLVVLFLVATASAGGSTTLALLR